MKKLSIVFRKNNYSDKLSLYQYRSIVLLFANLYSVVFSFLYTYYVYSIYNLGAILTINCNTYIPNTSVPSYIV